MPGEADDGNNGSDETFSSIPVNLQELVKAVGFGHFDHMADDEREVFEKVQQGLCMTCHAPLGEEANFIVNRFGIVGGYCGGQCHSDMAVLGWIQESHQDILDAVNFRGGGGDTEDG